MGCTCKDCILILPKQYTGEILDIPSFLSSDNISQIESLYEKSNFQNFFQINDIYNNIVSFEGLSIQEKFLSAINKLIEISNHILLYIIIFSNFLDYLLYIAFGCNDNIRWRGLHIVLSN
jgi:hypothetical protein